MHQAIPLCSIIASNIGNRLLVEEDSIFSINCENFPKFTNEYSYKWDTVPQISGLNNSEQNFLIPPYYIA